MIGQSGTGKSSLLRLLICSLNPGLYKLLYLCHFSVGNSEFYTHLCVALGLEPRMRRATMFRAIKDHIISLNRSQRVHPVLLIDEAHLLSTDILQELRMLTNFEIDSFNALTVLLCGQKRLRMKFGLAVLESLASTISITISLGGLPKEETFSYVEARLKAAGAQSTLFTKNALELIHQAAGGIMRTINTIAHAALIKGFIGKSAQVEAEHVQSVLER